MAQPFMGCRARIFRSRRSRVPWSRSEGLLIGAPWRLSSVTEGMIHKLLSVSKGNVGERQTRVWCEPIAHQGQGLSRGAQFRVLAFKAKKTAMHEGSGSQRSGGGSHDQA